MLFQSEGVILERNYKDINLDRDCIRKTIEDFVLKNSRKLRALADRPGGPGLRIVIGGAGIDDSTVDVFFNKNGTSTLSYKIGRNQELGQAVADVLYETIHPDGFSTINLGIKGIDRSDAAALIEELTRSVDAGIIVASLVVSEQRQIWKLKSEKNSDELTVTQHGGTNTLQIQGRPLSCYRELSYLLTEVLELKALECILFKKEDNRSEIVCVQVAEVFLKEKFGDCFSNLPESTKRLLLASLCVRLASPPLPDYCMLVYPELRSLEGAIRQRLAEKGLSHQEDSFGGFFKKAGGQFLLKEQYQANVGDDKLEGVLNDSYTFFNKQRHGLFHMDENPIASRMISSIEQAIALCDQAYFHLRSLYD